MSIRDSIKLIIVFKKEITEKSAEKFLKKTGIQFHSGMDSSKGKLYFYSTGPKFILTFTSEDEKNKFVDAYENSEEVYEIYIPNWDIQKD